MSEDKLTYVINDSRCKEALNEFHKIPYIENWVYQYMGLFKQISINVDGLPSIASCNYQGRHFESIKEFHSFFKRAMEVIDDPFEDKYLHE
jgi:hypothetical protein